MRKKSPLILVVFLCVLAYGASAFHFDPGQVLSVSVDLTRPESIIWPCEITIVGDMGEEGLRIPPKVGQGWRGKSGGEATYRFYVPEDGRYHIWAHALWFDKCANAIFAKIDRHDKAIVGNDPIYGRWHWVRGFATRLKKGAHALKLSNHSDHIALQKILFINSRTALPDDCSLVFSDIFYDGFDGCHIGNFASWEPVTGEWEVQMPNAEACYTENALIGKSEQTAMILYDGYDWSDYSYHVAVRTVQWDHPEATVGILFGVRDADHHHQLRWSPVDGTDNVQMELSRHEGQTEHVLATFQSQWSMDQWHEVQVVLDEHAIKVFVDSQPQVEKTVDHDVIGGIGLFLQGRSTAYFDDVHVRSVTEGIRP